MLLLRGVPVLVLVLLWLYCLFDAVSADPARVRNLPKPVWVVVVLLVPDVGSLLWLVAGRPVGAARALPQGSGGVPPEYDRPGRHVAQNPDDDAAFLEGLRRRAEDQRRRAAEDRRRAAEDARRLRDEEQPPPA